MWLSGVAVENSGEKKSQMLVLHSKSYLSKNTLKYLIYNTTPNIY